MYTEGHGRNQSQEWRGAGGGKGALGPFGAERIEY